MTTRAFEHPEPRLWAVSLDLEVPGGLDDDQADTLASALTAHAGILCHHPDRPDQPVQVVLDITALDPIQAAGAGEQTVRELLSTSGLPATGALLAVEVLTPTEQQRRNSTPPPTLLGVSDIAQLLSVSRQRIDQLRTRPDFPAPLAVLRTGPLWTEPSLQHFLRHWDRSSGRRPRSRASA